MIALDFINFILSNASIVVKSEIIAPKIKILILYICMALCNS